MKKIFIALLLTHLSTAITAQTWNQNMRMGEWNVTVDANQFTAKTIMELSFCNDNIQQDAEAYYYFYLQPNQAITHFELMLGDKYRDGTIEERWKAVSTYNTIVGKRVDPAVLQKSYGNTYTLNIYPVANKGCRKVRITIQEKLKTLNDNLVYKLPLFSMQKVSKFNFSFSSLGKINKVAKGLLKGVSLKNNSIKYTNSFDKLQDTIELTMPLQRNTACIEKKDSITYIAYRTYKKNQQTITIKPQHLITYWDLSLLNANKNIDLEINYLQQFLEENNIQSFDAVGFNHSIVFNESYSINTIRKLKTKLKIAKYIGASNFNIIKTPTAQYDLALLFSKGSNSYTKKNSVSDNTLIQAIVADDNIYNKANLEKLVTNTGGQVIALRKNDIATALAQTLVKRTFIETLLINNTPQPFVKIDSSLDNFDILYATSKAPIESLTIKYDNGENGVVHFTTNELCSATNLQILPILYQYENLYTYTARKRYRDYYDNYWARALVFGRRNGIVTEQTAYLVLERIEDYIKYGIKPPKEIEHLIINDPTYVKQVERDPFLNIKEESEAANLKNAIYYYNAYASNFGKVLFKSKATILSDKLKVEQALAVNNTTTADRRGDINVSGERLAKSEEVVVVGYGASKKSMRLSTSSAQIITAKEITANSSTTFSTLLAGRVSGVYVTQSSGTPGSIVDVRIRGINSLSNNQPLYILDGIAVDASYVSNGLNVNDIQYITVLKDIQASAIYGSRAANGAIVIETKRGKNNRVVWERYKLTDMQDVDYMADLRESSKDNLYAVFEALKKDEGHKINFYTDAGEIFVAKGLREEGLQIILSALEMSTGFSDHLGVAMVLDVLGFYTEAQHIYEDLLEEQTYEYNAYYTEGLLYRNIALSKQLSGDIQGAADAYYKGIVNSNYYGSNTSILEFQALLQQYKNKIDTANYELIFEKNTLPLKHVAIQKSNAYYNYYNYSTAQLLDHKTEISATNNYSYDFVQSYNFPELKGSKAALSVGCYNYSNQTFELIRVVEYENFGTANQKMTVKLHNTSNQYGDVILQNINY